VSLYYFNLGVLWKSGVLLSRYFGVLVDYAPVRAEHGDAAVGAPERALVDLVIAVFFISSEAHCSVL